MRANSEHPRLKVTDPNLEANDVERYWHFCEEASCELSSLELPHLTKAKTK